MERIRQSEKESPFPAHEHLIYFIDRPGHNWWDTVFRTREGFKHCFLTHWDEWAQRWLVLDWRQHKTDLLIMYDFELEKMLDTITLSKCTVVRFEPLSEKDNPGVQLITYCSNLIGRFLGLGNRVLLTPYGLYRTLLLHGGEVTYSWRHANEFRKSTKTNSTAKRARGNPARTRTPATSRERKTDHQTV